MAEGLGSLASGFISGFQMMDGYQRGKKEDARADKLMGLRELESQRDHDYKQWDMKHTEGRAKRKDFENDRTHDQGLRQFAADQDYRNRTLSLQKQQEARLARAQQFEVEQVERQRFQEEHAPLFSVIYEKAAAGQPLTDDEMRIATDPRAGKFNIGLYNSEALQAGQTALRELDGIIKQGAAGELDAMEPRALHQRINSPEITSAMKVITRGDASKVEGKIDPTTGKMITKAEFSDFMPLPPGEDGVPRFAINLAVTYDDGTTERKPVTEGRSPDQKDPIKHFTIPTLGNYLGQHTYLSQAVVNSGIQEKLGFTEGPDHKGYKGAAKDYLLESEKAITRLIGSREYQEMSSEQQEAALTQATGRRDEALGSIQTLYGVGGKGGEQGDPLTAWAGKDPGRQQFLQALAERGELKALADDPELIDMAYQRMQLQAQEQQQNAVAAGIEERIAGKGGQQKQGWTGATPSLGSAPSLREAMDIPPGDVRTTEKEFINAVARPYLNNATPGNQPAAQGRLADAWRNAYPSINR
ncbi:hypothetical protein C7I36_04790 [Zobellella taiwanensis]|uniref:Uncharacterized protein n=1 Tax=Zobellella taiwanensis TaxID=347535 RepID=A0A2P7R5A0_9GAMM|nr:hypothetical protein [Zobellella taiwanensis]PSJ45391.1 hypothetical protein C7I36_04790 [Zobellella taiwanensis]